MDGVRQSLSLPGNGNAANAAQRQCECQSFRYLCEYNTMIQPVERVSSQCTVFGGQSDAPETGCEIRVSWTPLDYADGGLDAGAQVGAWAEFLRSMTQSEEDYSVD